MFLQGLTVLDIMEAGGNTSLSLSHVAARQEVRDLLKTLQIPLITDRISKAKPEGEVKEQKAQAPAKPVVKEVLEPIILKAAPPAEAPPAVPIASAVQAPAEVRPEAKAEAKPEPVISANTAAITEKPVMAAMPVAVDALAENTAAAKPVLEKLLADKIAPAPVAATPVAPASLAPAMETPAAEKPALEKPVFEKQEEKADKTKLVELAS
jgi:hypothetical protein